jgi:phage shock protein PspC (stress-responsive transcriptional regulator)
MKKTISINISGQVFNIEEDGYDKLKGYLGAITKYFSSYGDSKEILTDIEGRIAEKFFDYLKKEETQAITSENIDSLIASMGTVADFEAIKEEEDLYEVNPKEDIKYAANQIKEEAKTENSYNESATAEAIPPKKLYRDSQRKILGGVCAGIAHYFSIDPIWVRLLFLGCLGLIPVLAVFSGFIFIFYIACWMAFPANADLKEDEKIKKFFRDPDKKVLAGVVAGVSKYTGVDLGILRLAFVLSIMLAGTGLMVYLILWAITPFAKTLTDKMQMKGEPITLENIESNIKSAKNFSGNSESAVATILLFPFRVLGKIFSAIGPLFQFLLIGVRIFAGLMLILIGASTLIGLVTLLFSAWGVFGSLPIGVIDNIPMHILSQDAPKTMFFFLFFAIAVPFLALAMAGFVLITKRNIFNAVIFQTLGGLWLMGLLGSAFSASKFAENFKRNGSIEKTISFETGSKTPTLDISDNEGWDNYHDVRFYLEPNSNPKIEVIERFEARGATSEIAQKVASAIKYDIKQADSLITFDRVFTLADNAPFRNQELRATINIPNEKVFYLTRQFVAHLNNFEVDWDSINWEIKTNRVRGNDAARFKFNSVGDLECLDKNPEKIKNIDENGNYYKEYSFNNFNEIEFRGNINLEIVEGPTSKIVVNGDNENQIEEFRINQNGQKLAGNYHESGNNEDEKISVRIETPNIENIKLAGYAYANIENFMKNKLKVSLSNNSHLKIKGRTEKLELDIHDNAKFEGDEFTTQESKISAYNQSETNLKVENLIKAEAFDQSKIEYTGKPKSIQLSPNGESSISKKSENE